ncbi:MAG: DUF547 domain-containing protein [Planctomycetota bacterium]|nr:MAG: DUF547 domain-containing protein [Planctomycetota bacterium]
MRSVHASLLSLSVLFALPAAGGEPDFRAYDRLLRAYVDERGLVDYAAFKRKDEAALRRCVAEFAAVDAAALEGNAKKAYWINVYNAVTLQAMLEFYPLRSIKDKVSHLPGGYNVWKDYRFGPQKVSLDEIEHKILRPLGDPRIHAAIVCASKGCPPLRNEAFVPERLDAQLDDTVRRWLRDPRRGLRVEGQRVLLSKIFDWFGEDFAPDVPGRLRWVARYVDEETARRLRSGGLEVAFLDWDWSLNAR